MKSGEVVKKENSDLLYIDRYLTYPGVRPTYYNKTIVVVKGISSMAVVHLYANHIQL